MHSHVMEKKQVIEQLLKVLILVVMEDALAQMAVRGGRKGNAPVLILVVMEDALAHTSKIRDVSVFWS